MVSRKKTPRKIGKYNEKKHKRDLSKVFSNVLKRESLGFPPALAVPPQRVLEKFENYEQKGEDVPTFIRRIIEERTSENFNEKKFWAERKRHLNHAWSVSPIKDSWKRMCFRHEEDIIKIPVGNKEMMDIFTTEVIKLSKNSSSQLKFCAEMMSCFVEWGISMDIYSCNYVFSDRRNHKAHKKRTGCTCKNLFAIPPTEDAFFQNHQCFDRIEDVDRYTAETKAKLTPEADDLDDKPNTNDLDDMQLEMAPPSDMDITPKKTDIKSPKKAADDHDKDTSSQSSEPEQSEENNAENNDVEDGSSDDVEDDSSDDAEDDAENDGHGTENKKIKAPKKDVTGGNDDLLDSDDDAAGTLPSLTDININKRVEETFAKHGTVERLNKIEKMMEQTLEMNANQFTDVEKKMRQNLEEFSKLLTAVRNYDYEHMEYMAEILENQLHGLRKNIMESTQEKIEKKVESFIKHWSQKEGNAIKSLKAAAECVLESRDVYNTLLIYLENLQKTTVQNEELIEKVHASVNMQEKDINSEQCRTLTKDILRICSTNAVKKSQEYGMTNAKAEDFNQFIKKCNAVVEDLKKKDPSVDFYSPKEIRKALNDNKGKWKNRHCFDVTKKMWLGADSAFINVKGHGYSDTMVTLKNLWIWDMVENEEQTLDMLINIYSSYNDLNECQSVGILCPDAMRSVIDTLEDRIRNQLVEKNSMQLKQLKNKLTGHEENEGERLARENAQLQAENNQLSKQLMDIAEKQNNQAKNLVNEQSIRNICAQMAKISVASEWFEQLHKGRTWEAKVNDNIKSFMKELYRLKSESTQLNINLQKQKYRIKNEKAKQTRRAAKGGSTRGSNLVNGTQHQKELDELQYKMDISKAKGEVYDQMTELLESFMKPAMEFFEEADKKHEDFRVRAMQEVDVVNKDIDQKKDIDKKKEIDQKKDIDKKKEIDQNKDKDQKKDIDKNKKGTLVKVEVDPLTTESPEKHGKRKQKTDKALPSRKKMDMREQ